MLDFLSTSPSKSIKKAWNGIPKNIRITFFVTFALGIFVHLYMMMGVYLNHDGLSKFMVSFNGLNTGRWVQGAAVRLGGFNAVPVVRGTLAIFYIAVSTCLIVYCLQIDKLFYSLFIGVLMVTFPATASSFMYIYTTDAIHFATITSVLAVFFCFKYQKYGFIAGGVMLGISLGMYQSYISFASAMFVLMLMLDVLRTKDSVKTLIIRAVKYFSSLVIGFLIYFPIMKLSLYLNPQHQLTTNKQMDQMGQISLSEVPARIAACYKEIISFFGNPEYFPRFLGGYSIYIPLIFLIFAAIAILLLFYLVLIRKTYETPSRFIFLLLLVAVWPMAVNTNYLMVQESRFVYLLMQYPLVLVYIFAVVLLHETDISLPKLKNNAVKYIAVILSWVQIAILLFLSYSYFIGINEGYVKASLITSQTYYYSEKLIENIESCPDYEKGMPVRTIGEAKHDDTLPYLNQNDAYGYTVKNNLVIAEGYHRFFEIYFGINFDIATMSDKEWLEEHAKEIEEMEIYPDQGAMKVIDGVLFIKLGTKI